MVDDPYGLGVLSRRRLLRLGLGSAALIVSGNYALRGTAQAVSGLRYLSARSYQTLDAIVDTLLPAEGAFPLGGRDVDLARELDDFFADAAPTLQRDFRLALTYVELGPLIHERRFTTFPRLTPPEREHMWRTWETCGDSLRPRVTTALRRICYLKFYDHPQVWTHIGYPGPLLSEHL